MDEPPVGFRCLPMGPPVEVDLSGSVRLSHMAGPARSYDEVVRASYAEAMRSVQRERDLAARVLRDYAAVPHAPGPAGPEVHRELVRARELHTDPATQTLEAELADLGVLADRYFHQAPERERAYWRARDLEDAYRDADRHADGLTAWRRYHREPNDPVLNPIRWAREDAARDAARRRRDRDVVNQISDPRW